MNLNDKNRIINERKEEKMILYTAMKNTVIGKVYGYINDKGLFVIKPKFQMAYDFKNGKAVVQENNKFGIIDTKGKYVLAPIYDSISEFKEGRAIVVINSKINVIDNDGKVITNKNYSLINSFSDGLVLVAVDYKNGDYKYGYINLEGEEVTPIKYLMGYDFNNGVALVKLDYTKYALINKKGQELCTYNHVFIYGYSDGVMVFADNFQGPYGYINNKGEEIIKAKYREATAFNNGVAVVALNNSYYGLIDLKGRNIYQSIFSDIKNLGEGIIALGLPLGDNDFIYRNIYALGTIDGEILTNFSYLEVGNYKDGVAYACNEEYTFFIDKCGNIVKEFPKVMGSGKLLKKGNLIYADIDYMPYYIGKYNSIVYKPNEIIKLDNKYSIFIKKYKLNINYLIYIPNILSDENKRVEDKINKTLEEESYFNGNGQKHSDITKDDVLNYNYYGDFNIRFLKKDLLSLDIQGNFYALGTAHPIASIKTFNINLKTGRFYLI